MRIKEIIEGQYQTRGQIQAQPGSWTTIWLPRKTQLQTRCQAVVDRILQLGLYKGLPPRIDVDLHDSYANTSPMRRSNDRPIIRIDLTVFWDAPEETLVFVLGHEMGHVTLGHDPTNIDRTPQQQQNNELEADRFAATVMQRLGYSQAKVFNFMHSKKAEYQKQELSNRQRDSTHPTYDQRIKQAGELGLKISHGGAQQLDHLMAE